MGKVGRFACIFTPMGLSIASLICLVLVFLGGTNKNSGTLRDLYFFKADASNFTSNPDLDLSSVTDIDNALLNGLKNSYANHTLAEIYTIHIWNYCTGSKTENGGFNITYCSPRKNQFWFDPVTVWGLNDTSVSSLFPEKLTDGLKVYAKVSKWMFIAYEVAFWATAAEIVVGFFAICSRWGSFLTTIVSSISSTFIFAAALTSTIMYSTLVATFNTVLKPYQIKGTVNTRMLALVWIAVAFSLGAGFFWLVSICCCSGKSDKKKVIVEKTPYTYERVGSPFAGHRSSDVPMHNMQGQQAGQYNRETAYEPFRHQNH